MLTLSAPACLSIFSSNVQDPKNNDHHSINKITFCQIKVALNRTSSDHLKTSILSNDFQKYLSYRVRIKATKRNISFCDSQTLISPFEQDILSVVATGR